MRKLARKSMAGTLLASLLFVAPLAVGAGERPDGHDPSGPETRLVGVVNVDAQPEKILKNQVVVKAFQSERQVSDKRR